MVGKRKKRAYGEGYTVKWFPSYNRIVGQVRRNGSIIARKYGRPGVDTPAEKKVVLALLKKWIELPATTDARGTVRAAIESYCARTSLEPRSRDRYKETAGYVCEALLSKRVIDVTDTDMTEAIAAIKGDPKRGATMDRTREMVFVLLRGAFNQQIKKRVITFNPIKAVEKPKYLREKDPHVFTPWEQRFLFAAAKGSEYEAMLWLALTMPSRPCEWLALRRCDVNLSRRTVSIEHDLISTKETGYKPVAGPSKTPESRRVVHLCSEAARAFAARLERQMATGSTTPTALVFTSPGGKPVRYSNLVRRWWVPMLEAAAVEAEKAARKAGDRSYRFPKDASLYNLRHTSFENMKAAGVALDVMHVLAGHKNLTTSMEHYNKPSDDRRRGAASAVSSWLTEQMGG